MRRSTLHLTLWLLVWVLPRSGAGAADAGGVAPAFDLARRGGGERARLAALRGRIVVLDFFAYWCAPCARASAQVESGLRRFYEQGQGNARGIPVSVLAVNIETNAPDKTEAFIQRAGLKRVFEDPRGELFHQCGGMGMPFVVVIDATGGRSGAAPPRVSYAKAGFDGVVALREIIDALGEGAAGRAAAPPADTVDLGRTSGGTVARKLSLDASAMLASDIQLTDELLEYRETRFASDLALSLSQGHIRAQYEPESPLEHKSRLDEDHWNLQMSGRVRANDWLTATASGGAYYGYLDYRSVWFDEYFRQLFAGRKGYETACPEGFNVSGGARVEYLPAAGFAQADVVYQYDAIAPGYEVSIAHFPPTLERFRADFNTVSGRLRLENVVTGRVRLLQELQLVSTTDRSLLVSLQSSLNYAMAEHWAARVAIFGTEEPPDFLAGCAAATLERDWNERWFLSVMGRYYRDTGEVENALLAENTADPPLQTFQTGAGLRWQGRQTSVKLFAGPYFTHYEQVGSAATTFPHLYQNRSWCSVQLAVAHEF